MRERCRQRRWKGGRGAGRGAEEWRVREIWRERDVSGTKGVLFVLFQGDNPEGLKSFYQSLIQNLRQQQNGSFNFR